MREWWAEGVCEGLVSGKVGQGVESMEGRGRCRLTLKEGGLG